MLETLYAIIDIDTFSAGMIIVLVGSIAWFLKTVVGSTGYAVLFAPFLVAGALAANYFRVEYGVLLNGDKDTQVALALAFGILLTLVILLAIAVIHIRLTDARSSRRRLIGQTQAGAESI